MNDIDWSDCPDMEQVPGRVSGQWTVVGTRILVKAKAGWLRIVFSLVIVALGIEMIYGALTGRL